MKNSITAIIPFYNSNTALKSMLDSILAGSLIPNEIILIDDGSDDISSEIAKEYSDSNSCIRYFRQEHSGVSAARNLGINQATGDWISFLDADDFIEPDMYSEMIKAVSDGSYDGCICGYYTHKDSVITPYAGNYDSPLPSAKILEKMFTDDNIRGFLFTRLFRSEIVKAHSFNSKVKMCEDLLFQTKIFSQADLNFAYVAKPFYHYVQNESQTTAPKNYFENGQFIYKPSFDVIKTFVHESYVDKNYNDIMEFSMYTLITQYKKSDNKAALKSQIRMLQHELKSTPCRNKSKRRYLYQLCPILSFNFIRLWNNL
ncbi:glycosyltransferase family 2 protein [Butyrivibrio sp. AE3006]|uniref:glycosyltransferase family 2 protein n=1 Tax=Butyrivibrio sp. AE3006 TaxID=1280673 RepID=UPI0005609C5A|nr:glycosyltransferase family 2 protein [Butyrivibrio sp. AE3006]